MRSLKMVAIFSLLLALILVGGVDAKPQKKKMRDPKAHRSIVYDVGLSITYDDNILRYSDADLDLFDSSATGGKFAIKSKDDWIIAPRFSPRISGRFLGGQLGWLDLGFSYFGYASNDVRRYSRLSLGVRQYVTPKLYGEVTYAYIPDYYYRNYQVGNTTNGLGVFAEAKFAKHMASVGAGYEFTKNLKAAVAYQYQHKTFNAEFDYRDLNGHGIEIGGDWRPIGPTRFWGSYGFERATARGADMTGDILDVSYDSWDMVFGARHYMGILTRIAPELFGSFQVRQTKYQTNRYSQIYYFGREDFNYLARIGLASKLPYRIDGGLEYSFAQKDANLPDIYPILGRVSQSSAELEHKLNYKSNSVTVRLARRF